MAHVDPPTLDALAASRTIPPRASLHIDSCVCCRRAAAERGVCGETIAANASAARARSGRLRAAAIIAAGVAAAVAALPLRGTALGFIEVFEPHTVTAVPLTLDDLRSLGRMSDLSAYASTRELRTSRGATFTNPRLAGAAAGFPLREPTAMPNGLRAASYVVTSPSGQLITFAARPKSPNPALAPLPPDIAGSTLRVDIGSTVVAMYQTAATIADEARMAQAFERINAQAASAARTTPSSAAETGSAHGAAVIAPATGARSASSPDRGSRIAYAGRVSSADGWVVANGSGSGEQPHMIVFGTSAAGSRAFRGSHGAQMVSATMPLVVVQMPVPQIASTGVSVQRIVSYMLNAPGIPPRVAAAFGALGDMSTTLPIPVPIDKAFSQPVIVDGVGGVGIGDNTGLGASVIWQKNGMLYAVFATQPARTVLAIANSLR
jgi:hypothetical protein